MDIKLRWVFTLPIAVFRVARCCIFGCPTLYITLPDVAYPCEAGAAQAAGRPASLRSKREGISR